jgi:formate dehydrogenase subunit gamma
VTHPSTDRRPAPARPGTVLRFDRVERAVHWSTACLFGILIATALPLYFSSIESFIGRRALIAQIHLWAGVALAVPIIVGLAGPWGARLRSDIRRCNLWSPGELRWLRTLGQARDVALDKFNPGQKLNAVFTGGVVVVMLATGLVMHSIHLFSVDWRTGATFVHDVVFFVASIVIVGHIGFALTHPAALRSMFKGTVTTAWVKRHAPAWDENDVAHSTAPGPDPNGRSTAPRAAGE